MIRFTVDSTVNNLKTLSHKCGWIWISVSGYCQKMINVKPKQWIE